MRQSTVETIEEAPLPWQNTSLQPRKYDRIRKEKHPTPGSPEPFPLKTPLQQANLGRLLMVPFRLGRSARTPPSVASHDLVNHPAATGS